MEKEGASAHLVKNTRAGQKWLRWNKIQYYTKINKIYANSTKRHLIT